LINNARNPSLGRMQSFPLACEEAKEVLDRRAGRAPATAHGALDFLDASDPRNAEGYVPPPAARGADSDGAPNRTKCILFCMPNRTKCVL
jgi:hypothetical protein